MVRMVRLSLCVYVLAGVLSLAAQNRQSRSIADGVYSSAQAKRGGQVYSAQCAGCHGNSMQGASGPPLAGSDFLSNWSARSVTELVSKIEKTMPFNQPASLSRQQSIDLVAYILETGKFPAGTAELSEAMVEQVKFPVTRSAPLLSARAAGAAPRRKGILRN